MTDQPSLESSRKSCDKLRIEEAGFTVTDTTYELIAVRCRSRFCEKCAPQTGFKLREKLKAVIAEWDNPYMITLTVDPSLFPSPRAAYQYSREQRVIGRTMRELVRRGHVKHKHYFCAVEWQKETEMVHYHLLVDSAYIPKEEIDQIWDRFRPKDAPPKEPNRPGFGLTRYSAPKFASSEHAANYATKYVTKVPEHGFPEWVMRTKRMNVPRYHVSQGFWSVLQEHHGKGEAWEPEEVAASADEWLYDLDNGFDEDTQQERPERHYEPRSIEERIDRCCERACVVRCDYAIEDGGLKREVEVRQYVGAVMPTFEASLEMIGESECDKTRLVISEDEMTYLMNPFASWNCEMFNEFAERAQADRDAQLSIADWMSPW